MTSGTVVTFDGSYDGFLCIIFAHYYDALVPATIMHDAELTLFSSGFGDTRHIQTCPTKAARVANGLRNKVSDRASHNVYLAFHAAQEGRLATIFDYVKLAFKLGHMVDSHLNIDCVRATHKLAGVVARESHLLNGFCRFVETTQGVLYSPITPRNDVLPIIVNHFSQRLMGLPWIIHDKHRNRAAVYDGNNYTTCSVPANATIEYANTELETQELWVKFFNALAIDARKNPKLQRQMLPLYFRKNMTEFVAQFPKK